MYLTKLFDKHPTLSVTIFNIALLFIVPLVPNLFGQSVLALLGVISVVFMYVHDDHSTDHDSARAFRNDKNALLDKIAATLPLGGHTFRRRDPSEILHIVVGNHWRRGIVCLVTLVIIEEDEVECGQKFVTYTEYVFAKNSPYTQRRVNAGVVNYDDMGIPSVRLLERAPLMTSILNTLKTDVTLLQLDSGELKMLSARISNLAEYASLADDVEREKN